MDGCNGSHPEGQQGKIRSVLGWLRAAAVSRWSWGIYLRLKVFLHRYRWLIFGGLTLLLAIYIQRVLPQWSVYSVQFLQKYPLVAITIALLLLILFLWKLPKWQVADIQDTKDRVATESAFRQTLVQLVGGAALLGGLYYTAQTLRTSQETLRVNQKTLETTQQGQITERFTKAIEQLGSDNRAIRLGGIYALERIARDSETDHGPVIEVLTTFVREQVPVQRQPENTPQEEKEHPDLQKLLIEKGSYVFQEAVQVRIQAERLRADIQAILTVLGRRTRTYGKGESQRLNLQFTNLQYADLQGAQLQGARLDGAQLQRANVRGAYLQHTNLAGAKLQNAVLDQPHLQEADLGWANLQGADLIHAELQQAKLSGAQLQGAIFAHAQLQGAILSYANLQGAIFADAQLQGATLEGAQLQGVGLDRTKNLTQDQINTACVDENTRLPEGLIRPAPCPVER
jgi:uncharacterized protein YjbI with pentapeptide repeats